MMARLAFGWIGLALIAAPSWGIAVERSPRVETEVYTALDASPDGKTHVVVMLRPVSGGVPERKARAAMVQDRVLMRLAPGDFEIAYRYQTFAALAGRVSAAGLARLGADPDVVSLGLDGAGRAQLDVSVPFIHADQVHTMQVTGRDQTVAVLDTGIDTTHPDLSDDIAAGAWHFLNQGANQGPGATDDNGHGTNVSGIITSKGTVSSRGVAPDADILAVKVLDASSSGFVSDWAAGVDYVVAHRNDYTSLCAINMSLGTFQLFSQCPCDNVNSFTQLLQAALQAAEDANIITFCSSGNQGSTTTMASPACLSSGVAVAAVYDQDLGREPNSNTYQTSFGSSFAACFDASTGGDKITCFSNRSPCNDLAAPGRLITAPGLGSGLSTYTGTSQASPHCAGVAALIGDRRFHRGLPRLVPDQLLDLLKGTGVATNDPAGTIPNPRRVDARAAVEAAAPSLPVAADPGLILLSILLLASGGWALRARLGVLAGGRKS